MVGLTNDIDRLTHVELFQSLSRKILGVLALAAQMSVIRPGHVAFYAGELVHGGYLIINGTLISLVLQNSSWEDKNADYLSEGSFLGECALVTSTVWNATLYAHTPVTLMHIPRKDFLRIIKAHPEAVPPIRKILEAKLEDFIISCKDILA